MGKVHRFFLTIFCGIVRLLLRLRYKIEVSGLEEILSLKKASKGILFLPNHPAEVDPIILMTILGPHFFPRSVMVEHFYQLKGFKRILDYVRVVPVPSMDEKANRWKKKELEKTFAYILEYMGKGENFIIYPAGKLKRSGLELIGGASFVHSILEAKEDLSLVLVRTTGLWGSSFSVGSLGKTPEFGKTFWNSCKVVLKNAFFFVPKRKVLVEFAIGQNLPLKEGRLVFNRALEVWYNKKGEEPLTRIPYLFWKKEEEVLDFVPEKVEEKDFVLPLEIQEEVFVYIANLAKISKDKVTVESDLSFDLGLDSLDIADIHAFLDKTYDAGGALLSDLKKVKDVLRAIAEKEEHKGSLGGGDELHDFEKKFSLWFSETKRKRPFLPQGELISEVFLRSAKRMGSLVACADRRSGVLSFTRLSRAVLVLAEEIRGLPGERVGVLLPASTAVYTTILAILMAGKIPVMLNWTAGKLALNHAFAQASFEVTLTSKKFLDKIALEELGDVEETFVFLEDLREGLTLRKKLKGLFRSFLSVEKILDKFSIQRNPNETAVILFTSGSESMPKGVPLSHKNILSNQRSALIFGRMTEEDSLYGVLPPFHSFGFSLTGLLPLLSGLKVFYAPDPTDSHEMLVDVEKMRLSILCLAPSFIKNLFLVAKPGQLNSVSLVISGAEKYSPDLPFYVKNNIPGAIWMEGYGITECSPVVALHVRGKENKGVGLPLSGVKIKIIDTDSLEEIGDGGDGEICISGEIVFQGYLGNDIKNPFLEKEGQKWYRSGDLGHLDDQGYLHLTDRLKRTVKIGGEMVSLFAVEQELESIGKNRQWYSTTQEGPPLAVIVRGSEKPELILCTPLEVSLEEINRALRESGMGRIIKISQVVRVASIPLTGTGKTHYRALQEQLKDLHV